MVFENILSIFSPIFYPLFSMNVFVGLIITSILVALLMTLSHKYFTDQHVLKHLKAELKKLQKNMKKNRDNPEKMMAMQKKMMSINFDVMKQSFKPVFIMMPLIFLIFGWIGLFITSEPINSGDTFEIEVLLLPNLEGIVTLQANSSNLVVLDEQVELQQETSNSFFTSSANSVARFNVEAQDVGEYALIAQYKNSTVSQDVLVTNGIEYIPTILGSYQKPFQSVSINYEKRVFFSLGFWPLRDVGSIGVYIILQIIFSLIFRRLFKLA